MGLDLVPYIKASYPILWIRTAEESRAEKVVIDAANKCKRGVRIWSCTEGYFTPDPENQQHVQCQDPMEALVMAKGHEPMTIFILRDFAYALSNPVVRRMMRDIARDFKQHKKMVIVITPIGKLPEELERDITLLEFDLPEKDEIEHIFDSLYKPHASKIGVITDDEKDKIVQSAMGLTTTESEAAFAKAFIQLNEAKKDKKKGEEMPDIAELVLSEKALAVRKTGILQYFEQSETTNDIGGLDSLKKWLDIRKLAFSRKAREFGLPMPRGILLVGLPGCGKSLSAKATASVLKVPLIRMDVGRLFGGLVGESESNLRSAVNTVEAIGNCVLWIDEMDKAFAGMNSSHSGDSGTSQRVFGNFITWLQEKSCPVFVVATVNRIEGLPPELLRKGRFDEIFFVGLPSEKEREEILKIHIVKHGRNVSKFDLSESIDLSDNFSGAEIAESVITGLYSAFDKDRDLKACDIELALKNTNPLSKSRADDLENMLTWASQNAVNASTVGSSNGAKNGSKSGGRDLDLGE